MLLALRSRLWGLPALTRLKVIKRKKNMREEIFNSVVDRYYSSDIISFFLLMAGAGCIIISFYSLRTYYIWEYSIKRNTMRMRIVLSHCIKDQKAFSARFFVSYWRCVTRKTDVKACTYRHILFICLFLFFHVLFFSRVLMDGSWWQCRRVVRYNASNSPLTHRITHARSNRHPLVFPFSVSSVGVV